MKAYIDESYVLGGVNYYEDPHFSYFYLSQSLNINTQNLYPGYSEIIALYINGTERYYIKKEETKSTAYWIINKLLANPNWFVKILNQIETISSKLKSLKICVEKEYSNYELIELYDTFYHLNIELYKLARLPEALDRGEPYFTNYLKNYLTKMGCSPKEIPILFNLLTKPKKESVLTKERGELDLIRQDILSCYPNIEQHYSPLMLLDTHIRASLKRHVEKWFILNYHGYRNPKFLSEYDFLNRIFTQKHENGVRKKASVDLSKYKIDNKHKILFSIYAEIGRVKIHRRFHQLYAFHFLDSLIYKIANRFHLSEIKLRFCLPNEIKALLLNRITARELANKNTEKCGIHYQNNSIVYLSDDEVLSGIKKTNKHKNLFNEDGVYFGHCVSLGQVSGRVKKIDDLYTKTNQINSGDIIVCQSLDPDFLPFIEQASGVITEQGGVTSHGAIICRELNIPTLSGVSNILEYVSNDDLVELDTYKEFVKVTKNDDILHDSILINRFASREINVIGNKALNLVLAKESGINVPNFLLLSYDSVRGLLLKNKNELLSIIRTLCSRITLIEKSMFLLRSSGVHEDSPDHFYAGYFKSCVLNLENPIKSLSDFIEFNNKKNYEGSIILQEFIDADYCGVCMIGDKNFKNSEHLVVEYSKGATNHATQGNPQIWIFVYDIKSDEFIGESSSLNDNVKIQADIIDWFKIIQAHFPDPTYIEWGYKDGMFYLYQLRYKN
jgi:phosphohistidine swiveling domain-containing protein